jgi:hypothetical protein
VAHIGETPSGQYRGKEVCRGNAFRKDRARDVTKFPAKGIDCWLSARRRILDAYYIGLLFPCQSRNATARICGLEFKMLAELVRTPPRESGKCYYFRTVTHPEFSHYREHFYLASRKIVPLALLEEQFSEISLAVWLMDDGAVDRKQVRLNTQSFSFTENETLASLLRAKFGIEARLNRDKDRYRLRVQ